MKRNFGNILVTGGDGFLGRTLIRCLEKRGTEKEIIHAPSQAEANLMEFAACMKITDGIDTVFHLAGRVPSREEQKKIPGEVFYTNVITAANIVEAARRAKVKKVVLVSSYLAYPENAKAPFREEMLWDGYPPPGGASYGLSKRIMAVQASAYRTQYEMSIICIIFPNFYGPGDKFDFSPPLVANLIKKIFTAKALGQPFVEEEGGEHRLELMYIDDAAEGVVMAAAHYDEPEPLNIGTGTSPATIKEIAEMIQKEIEYKGELRWAHSDQTPTARALDISKQKKVLKWLPETSLQAGIHNTVEWFLKHHEKAS